VSQIRAANRLRAMPIESLRRETLLESGGPAPGSRERPRCDL